MQTVLIVLHVLLAIALIGMVLVQRGAGATAGAAFGSGASSTVFGSRGASSFLTRTTGVLAAGFFLISLSMAVLVSRGGAEQAAQDLGIMSSVTDQAQQQEEQTDAPPATDVPVDASENEQSDAPPAASGEEETTPVVGAASEEGEGG